MNKLEKMAKQTQKQLHEFKILKFKEINSKKNEKKEKQLKKYEKNVKRATQGIHHRRNSSGFIET